MVSPKSQTEVYLNLCVQLVLDDPHRVNPPKLLQKDVETMKSRTISEGMSFLTKSLPKLGKALDDGLNVQRFTPVSGFRTQKGWSTPAFLQAYFNRVFGRDGLLLEEPDVDAIKHLRQVLFFAYKLELPYSAETEKSVLDSFVATEEELKELVIDADDNDVNLAARITAGIFSGFNPKDILPRHGPGAVATGERLEQKWEFSRLYDQIHQYYPYYDYYIVGRGNELIDRREWYRRLDRLQAGQAKVVLVPKDSRGPRLISAEPLEYQWIQQGLGRKFVQLFEGENPLTKGQVNFTRQDINQQLATSSSTDRRFATLDLKDASDRVSLQLVRRIFGLCPEIVRALEAARTTETVLPDGRVVHLEKYAPMGSALCFPVEAYCFWVLMVSAMVNTTRMPLRMVCKRIFVYGDDLIVPTDWAPRCIQVLEKVGLRVNLTKSCIHGFFRESCGTDAFKGVNITPIRLKKLWSGRPGDGTAMTSYASLANSLLERGYTGTCELMRDLVEGTYGLLPYGTPTSGFPCRLVHERSIAERFNLKRVRTRWNSRYQRLEFMVKFASPRRIDSALDGWPRLLRDVTHGAGQEPSQVVVPRSTVIKRGWRAC